MRSGKEEMVCEWTFFIRTLPSVMSLIIQINFRAIQNETFYWLAKDEKHMSCWMNVVVGWME